MTCYMHVKFFKQTSVQIIPNHKKIAKYQLNCWKQWFSIRLCEVKNTQQLLGYICLQCFDAVGWAAGRASDL